MGQAPIPGGGLQAFLYWKKGGETMVNAPPVPLIPSPFPNVGEMLVMWGRRKDSRLAENHKAIEDLDSGKLF